MGGGGGWCSGGGEPGGVWEGEAVGERRPVEVVEDCGALEGLILCVRGCFFVIVVGGACC